MDEIGDLSLAVQAKLLKLLEEGVYEPLGSTVERQAHIRIISATNQSIPDMIKQKKFREDLYYRINSVILEIPPLREHKEDILPLAAFLWKSLLRKITGKSSPWMKIVWLCCSDTTGRGISENFEMLFTAQLF